MAIRPARNQTATRKITPRSRPGPLRVGTDNQIPYRKADGAEEEMHDRTGWLAKSREFAERCRNVHGVTDHLRPKECHHQREDQGANKASNNCQGRALTTEPGRIENSNMDISPAIATSVCPLRETGTSIP